MASSVSSLVSGIGSNVSSTSTNASTGVSTSTSTGLGQGIDVSSFVQLALSGQQAQITNLEGEQSAVNTEISTLAPIQSDLSVLQTAVKCSESPTGSA